MMSHMCFFCKWGWRFRNRSPPPKVSMFFEIGRSILKHVPAVREIYTYYHCRVEFDFFFHKRSLWKVHVYSAASIRVVFVGHDMTFIILVLLSESSFSVCSFTTHFPKCFEQNHHETQVYYLFISGLVQFLHYFIPLALVAFNMMCLARLDMHHLEFRELAEQAKYLSCQTVPRCASRLADGCGFNKGNRNYIREVQRKTSRPQQRFERSLGNRPRLDVSIGVYFWCLESFPKQSSYKKLIEEWHWMAIIPWIISFYYVMMRFCWSVIVCFLAFLARNSDCAWAYIHVSTCIPYEMHPCRQFTPCFSCSHCARTFP